MSLYKYNISGNAFRLYPMEIHYAYFSLEDGSIVDIPKQYPFGGEWGEVDVQCISLREHLSLPRHLDLVYLSIVEKKFFELSLPINNNALNSVFNQFLSANSNNNTITLIVGMAPYGRLALWLGSTKKQILLGWIKTDETNLSMSLFLPENPNMQLSDYCNSYIDSEVDVKAHLSMSGLPPVSLFDKYMQQFTCRYFPLFEHWDEDKGDWNKYEEEETKPELDYIEEALFDGTHDKLHDGGLMNYHPAGKPKKLAVNWHIKKSEYKAYFWFEDEEIRAIFDRFYGAHLETKTDFMIRIDADHNKYELALYRYGLKEPQVISELAYQLLVFKNKFECYRSENYNQPKGAWIW